MTPKKIAVPPRERGQVLVGVIMLLLVLLIMVPALVQWTQIESRSAVKNQKATTSFNLAQAAVERGLWKIQSTTQTWADASTGTVITGYHFDVTYHDVPGGTYRIMVQSSGTLTAMVTGEGRDSSNGNTRAISAVYKSQTIYSPLMATQGVSYTLAMVPNWGPIMSQGSITLNDNWIGNMYYPRKFAQDVVQCGGTCNSATNARDTNGLTPPNTDNAEWWSDYQYVPPLPVLDFAALRSSAAATDTLNVYGCNQSAVHTSTKAADNGALIAGAAPWDSVAGRGACGNFNDGSGHADHFAASYNHVFGANLSPAANTYVWYWDHDVVLAGDGTAHGQYGIGLHGTVIVRGNLTLDANGDYDYTGNVPANAWAEYGLLTKGVADTAAVGEYPADNGFHKNLPTFAFGTQSMTIPGVGVNFINTVGIRGFTYVGGNLTITTNGFMDFNGAVWVNGSVIATGASTSHFCGVYYDAGLVVPTLNVVLARESWNEVSASTITWAP